MVPIKGNTMKTFTLTVNTGHINAQKWLFSKAYGQDYDGAVERAREVAEENPDFFVYVDHDIDGECTGSDRIN
jgi:hypothetical protein